MTRPSNNSRNGRRRGLVAAEALLILPLFLLVAVGMVGIADLLIAEQLVDEASGRGARAAAIRGSQEDVEAAVLAVLGEERAKEAKITAQGIDGTELKLVPPGALLEVRVELDVKQATMTRLAPVFGSEPIAGRTVMLRE